MSPTVKPESITPLFREGRRASITRLYEAVAERGRVLIRLYPSSNTASTTAAKNNARFPDLSFSTQKMVAAGPGGEDAYGVFARTRHEWG